MYKDICLVRLSAIGDTCHALAVARNIADNWPDANITWIIGRTESYLLGDIPDIEFIIFDKSKGREGYADVRKAVAARRFDVALCMHAAMRINPLYRKIPAPVRLGFDFRRARDFQWLFTNERIRPAPREHALDAMMGFARHIGAAPMPLRWDIPLSAADRAYADEQCRYPTLVISPLSSQRSRNFRNWPAERFAEVVRYAESKYGCRILLTGGPTRAERDCAAAIAAAAGGNLLDLVGRTTLKQSLAVFAAADAVLCPDSGPAHMATAVGTPVIGLYATSNPLRTGPYVSRQLTVDRYPDALRMYLGKSADEVRWGRRVRDPAAMELIEVADVTEKIDMVFQGGDLSLSLPGEIR